MSFVVLCDHYEAAGFFVEAMHDARARVATDRGQRGEMMQQGIDQRATIALVVGGSGSGVDHHAGRLVDNGEIVVFVEDVEGDFLGDGSERSTLSGAEDRDALAAAQLEGRLGGCVVQQYLFLGDKFLHPSAAHVEARGEVLVEALAGVIGRNRDKNWECFRHSTGRILQTLRNSTGPSGAETWQAGVSAVV